MGFLRCTHDRQTVDLMTRALKHAWDEFETKARLTDTELEAAHAAMVRCMLAAVKIGERDVVRLKLLALGAVRDRETA